MLRVPDNKNFITPSIPMAILLIASYLAMWTGNFLIKGYAGTGLLSELFQGWISFAGFFLLILIHGINLLLIAQINSRFSIIRVRTFIPIFIFALLMVVWYNQLTNIISFIALTVWFICLILVLNNYRNVKGVESSFLLTFILFLISLLNPVYILLIPVFWFALIIIKSMSLRVFLASLSGFLLALILYIVYLYLTESNDYLLPSIYNSLIPGINPIFYNIYTAIYSGIMLIMTILCLIGLFSNIYSDTVQIRKNTYLLIYFLFVTFGIIILFPQASGAYMPILAACISFIIAHPITLKKSDFIKTIFYLFILTNLAYFVFKLLYSN
jgi:hypothetical protein